MLPRFFTRAAAAIDLVTGDGAETARARLQHSHATITSATSGEDLGFAMSVNLAARLFPAIDLHAEGEALERAANLATAINPDIDLGPASGDQRTVTIRHGAAAHDPPTATAIDVRADSWNVHVDDPDSRNSPAHPAAAMMAGVLGISEAFRIVFADLLPRPRTGPTPMAWNLLDLRAPHNRAPVDLPIQISTVHLAGAGAIGQAAVAALAAWPGLTGTLVPVDPETVDLSNLQRYVLTDDVSVNQQKTDIAAAALSGTDIIVLDRPTGTPATPRKPDG